jgi:hypothetical protein
MAPSLEWIHGFQVYFSNFVILQVMTFNAILEFDVIFERHLPYLPSI